MHKISVISLLFDLYMNISINFAVSFWNFGKIADLKRFLIIKFKDTKECFYKQSGTNSKTKIKGKTYKAIPMYGIKNKVSRTNFRMTPKSTFL